MKLNNNYYMNLTLHDALRLLREKDHKHYTLCLYTVSKYVLLNLPLCRALNDPKVQKEQIMLYLSNEGIRLLHSLVNCCPDITTRKLSAKILCQLAYENELIQSALCDLFHFSTFGGKVVINNWPSHLKQELQCNPDVLRDIKRSAKVTAGKEFWSFPEYRHNDEILRNKVEYITRTNNEDVLVEYYRELAQIDARFPDPKYYLIGFSTVEAKSKTPERRRTHQSIDFGNLSRKRNGFGSVMRSVDEMAENKKNEFVGKVTFAKEKEKPREEYVQLEESDISKNYRTEGQQRASSKAKDVISRIIDKFYNKHREPANDPSQSKFTTKDTFQATKKGIAEENVATVTAGFTKRTQRSTRNENKVALQSSKTAELEQEGTRNVPRATMRMAPTFDKRQLTYQAPSNKPCHKRQRTIANTTSGGEAKVGHKKTGSDYFQVQYSVPNNKKEGHYITKPKPSYSYLQERSMNQKGAFSYYYVIQ